jgi:hypothetical protein
MTEINDIAGIMRPGQIPAVAAMRNTEPPIEPIKIKTSGFDDDTHVNVDVGYNVMNEDSADLTLEPKDIRASHGTSHGPHKP